MAICIFPFAAVDATNYHIHYIILMTTKTMRNRWISGVFAALT